MKNRQKTVDDKVKRRQLFKYTGCPEINPGKFGKYIKVLQKNYAMINNLQILLQQVLLPFGLLRLLPIVTKLLQITLCYILGSCISSSVGYRHSHYLFFCYYILQLINEGILLLL